MYIRMKFREPEEKPLTVTDIISLVLLVAAGVALLAFVVSIAPTACIP